MEENKIAENKSFWRRFNPTLEEMQERHPNISILGLWWSWYWRLALLIVGVLVIFSFISFVFSLFSK